MSEKYYFHDSDELGFEERDIFGDAYRDLLSACCKYSAVFALLFMEHIDTSKQQDVLSPFEIEVPNAIPQTEIERLLFCHGKPNEINHLYRKGYGSVKFYRVCSELCECLPSIANSMFGWLGDKEHANPENPTFYRADGSIFFASVIHEGECALFPRDDEDVSKIVQNEYWDNKSRVFEGIARK